MFFETISTSFDTVCYRHLHVIELKCCKEIKNYSVIRHLIHVTLSRNSNATVPKLDIFILMGLLIYECLLLKKNPPQVSEMSAHQVMTQLKE